MTINEQKLITSLTCGKEGYEENGETCNKITSRFIEDEIKVDSVLKSKPRL